jgi:ABC-2 type transport system permease protein
VILPAITLAVIMATHIIVLALSTVVLKMNGIAIPMIPPLFRMWLAIAYGLVVIALWHAPIYGWLLVVSAWARRATFLSAVLPPFAIGVIEKVAFNTKYFVEFLHYRMFGWFPLAFIPAPDNAAPLDPLQALTPGRFFSTPGLWIGLIFTAGFLAVAVRLRRSRGPI